MTSNNYYVTLRRIESAFRVVVRDSGLEHTHHHAFLSRRDAWDFVVEIRRALQAGRDLNLAHWDSTSLS